MILDMDRSFFLVKVNSPKWHFVRKGRCTALKPTELLIFHRDDYKWQHDWIMVHGWCMVPMSLLWRFHLSHDDIQLSGVLELHKRRPWKSVWLSCEWPKKVTMQKHGEVDKSLLGDGLNWLDAFLAPQRSEQPEVCWLIWDMWIFKPWRVPWQKTTTSESMRSFVREVRLSALSLWRVDSARLFGSFIRSSLSIWLFWKLT